MFDIPETTFMTLKMIDKSFLTCRNVSCNGRGIYRTGFCGSCEAMLMSVNDLENTNTTNNFTCHKCNHVDILYYNMCCECNFTYNRKQASLIYKNPNYQNIILQNSTDPTNDAYLLSCKSCKLICPNLHQNLCSGCLHRL